MVHAVTLTAPTSVVDNLAATPGIRTVKLSWLPPSLYDPNTIIENYNLTCTPQVADLANIKMNYSQPGMHRVVGFHPATEYNFSISASNSAGYGPSAMITVVTMDDCKILVDIEQSFKLILCYNYNLQSRRSNLS